MPTDKIPGNPVAVTIPERIIPDTTVRAPEACVNELERIAGHISTI